VTPGVAKGFPARAQIVVKLFHTRVVLLAAFGKNTIEKTGKSISSAGSIRSALTKTPPCCICRRSSERLMTVQGRSTDIGIAGRSDSSQSSAFI
jgi:hypothetical protein